MNQIRLITLLGVCLTPLSSLAAGGDRFAPIQTFLTNHCVECHGVKAKKAGLALNVYKDEAGVLEDRKLWQKALEMVQEGEMPPAKRPRPTDAELASFVHGLDAIFDEADRTAKPDPGRVTVRRLNRTEYNNTVRDLVGIDFQPAEDFPSDDIGHGFDNVGDVLTISPILMERYLAAAESIVQRAILPDPPKPQVRRTSARNLEPALKDTQQRIPYRALEKGTFSTSQTLGMDGEYIVRARAYAPRVGNEPAKIALKLDDKELKQFTVTGVDEKGTAAYEAKVTLDPGQYRFAVALLNPADGEEKRKLFVESIQVEGPADTRPASQRKLLATAPGLTRPQQTREVLTRFATRAYRRPATTDEVARLTKLVNAAEQRGEKWEAGIQMAMQAVLVSPKFLFRVELDDRPQSSDPRPISEYQLASRLSYFLWSTMPDQELFDLAARNQLTINLEPQVRRMLKDPRSKSLVENFAMQWLQLRRLRMVAPDTRQFPSFDERLRVSMQKETELFLNAIIQEDRSILDIIDGNFTFVNRALARLYGLPEPQGGGGGGFGRGGFRRGEDQNFTRVTLPPGSPRGGILTQASILTVTSNPTRTSPVKRGRWVLEQLLGAPPPPPPPDVPELKEDSKAQLSGSLRQRMEQHRVNPACANCHAKMDPIGFAFENFDAVGAFRQKEGEFTIDPSGTLPDGRSFKGPAELRTILKEKKVQFARCLTEKMMTYALGRGIEYYDRRAVDKVCAALAKDDYRFSRLVIEIVQGDPFRLRRGSDPKPAPPAKQQQPQQQDRKS
jgi:PAS domain-containing protein